MKTLSIPFLFLPHGRTFKTPEYATLGSAGMDLRAAFDTPLLLAAQERVLVPTGIACALPSGYEAQVRSRSGLALHSGIIVLNAPGTIDADYRGEIKVILMNLSQDPFTIEPGMRIAQLVVSSYVRVEWQVQSTLDALETQRGDSGFGSTGL